jgi:hypothetical protein
MRCIWFVDPMQHLPFLLIICGSEIGVMHKGCRWGADVSIDLDSFFCHRCGCNGRISGAWVLERLGEDI